MTVHTFLAAVCRAAGEINPRKKDSYGAGGKVETAAPADILRETVLFAFFRHMRCLALLVGGIFLSCIPICAGSGALNKYILVPSLHIIKPAAGNDLSSFGNNKLLLLTFDDAPGDLAVDRKILGILDKHSAKSIWFLNCAHFGKPGPDRDEAIGMLKDAVDHGHLIGNHGYSHVNLHDLERTDPRKLDYEIAGCSSEIEHTIGVRPMYFRPPWGMSSPAIRQMASDTGMDELNWSANSLDTLFYRRPATYGNFILGEYLARFQDGDVVLFHDFPHTADALDDILTVLERRGFRFVIPG